MKCQNRRCGQQVDRLVCWTDKKGKPHWGCPGCIWTFRPEAKNMRVRTGRKIVPAYEVYGVERTKEMNQRWFKGQQEKAARTRQQNAVISEGAFKVLEEHSRRGLIRPRVDGRPAR